MKYLLMGLAFCSAAEAAGNVTSLNVEQQVVTFITSEAKSQSSPACMAAEHANKWTVSLDSQSGRATYSMLITAMSLNIPVNVETANDCADATGLERAARVWYEVQ